MERPRAVAEVPLDLAHDRRDRVGRELHRAAGVKALDREQKADRPDLDEVFLRLTASRVAPGKAANEGHVALDEPVAGAFVPLPVGLDQSDEIDVLRHDHAPFRRATLIPSSIQEPSPPSAGTS